MVTTNGWKRVLLACLAAAAMLASPARAQEEEPGDPRKPATELTETEVARLKTAWEKRRPKIALAVGQVNGQGVLSVNDPLENALRVGIAGQLTKAITTGLIEIVDRPTDVPTEDLKRDAAQAIAVSMGKRNVADFVIVVMLQDLGQGRSDANLRILDVRGEAPIGKAAVPLVQIDRNPGDIRAKANLAKYSRRIAQELLTVLEERAAESVYRYYILGIDDDDTDELVDFLDDCRDKGIAHVSDPANEKTEGLDWTVFDVTSTERRTRVKKLLSEGLEKQGRKLDVTREVAGTTWGRVVKNTVPAWCKICPEIDKNPNEAFDGLVQKRQESLRRDEYPKIAVYADTRSPGLTDMKAHVEQWFLRMGFEVTSDFKPPLPVVNDGMVGNLVAMMREDQAFRDALRQVRYFVTIVPRGEGEDAGYSLQMTDMREGAGLLVGNQVWPDRRATDCEQCEIDTRDAQDIAKYMVANLVETIDKRLNGDLRFRRVVVRVKGLHSSGLEAPKDDAENAEVQRASARVFQLVNLLNRSGAVDPQGTTTPRIDQNVAEFTIEIKGTLNQVLEDLTANLTKLDDPPYIESARSHELVLSFERRGAAGTPASVGGGGKARTRENAWALLVGVNYTGDPIVTNPLRFCVRDVELMRSTLVECGYSEGNIVFMTDDLPQSDPRFPNAVNVLQQLENLVKKAKNGDEIIVHFSGHGSAAVRDGQAVLDQPVFLARSVQLSATQWARGDIPLGTVRAIIEKAAARQIVMFVDACHSGGSGAGDAPRDLVDAISRAISAANQSVGTLSGCRLNQCSLEDSESKQGYFTKALSDGIRGQADSDPIGGNRDGQVSLYELFLYVQSQVKARTSGEQQPQYSGHFLDEVFLANFQP